jgi:hypothetical protein
MKYLNISALEQTALETDPYPHVVVPEFVVPAAFPSVYADFPKVPGAGSHPPSELQIRGDFQRLVEELHGSEFRHGIEKKFGIDLADRATMYTVRGYTRQKDGAIHTDSKTKIVTVLLYFNEAWDDSSGRLRILRSGTDINDYVTEIAPIRGNLLAFVRSDKSWHGHEPFAGPRRALQFNWVTAQSVADKEQSRHRLSTRIKKIKSMLFPSAT